jgi:hypothetical protein
VDIRFRSINGEEPKYMGMPGTETRLYNVSALHRASEFIAVCEGEIDAITLDYKCGIPAVGVPGANSWKRHYSKLLLDFQTIYSSRLWDYCEVCGDDEHWDRDEVDIIKKHKDMTKEDYFRFDLYNVQDELADVLLSKHQDYGKNNIIDAPGGALNGIRVRMHDKVARLNNLLDNNKEPKHESIRDTLIDIANYATIAIMVIDDTWDK